MHVQVTSDNHIEFLNDKSQFAKGLAVNSDILIVAGDLGTHSCIIEVLKQLCAKFKHIVYVTGNHEFYKSSFPQVRATLRDFEAKTSKICYCLIVYFLQ